ncbi:MAG TPA: enoyl-CoA hydratase-related protein [Polyangiaceae bacterium]|jgi:enoyl-CoA hydratase/carnithine racemase|nr:enoyl-CoA hydratase-related protein [Polyangiaceae bacterium]
MTALLQETSEDRVAWLTLNRPQVRNALDPDLVADLAARMEALAADREIRVIVLSGAGGAFCAGADLRASAGVLDQVADVMDIYHRVIRAIASAPQPVIGMIDGAASGFGCDLALACDLRVMSDRAYLQEAFVRIGLMPDGGGTMWLPRALGLARALELMLTGDRIEAAVALAWGLANSVVAPDKLKSETAELAARLAKGAPLAQAYIKRAARAAFGSIDEALAREKQGQLELLRTQDFAEGLSAFLQKRAASFRGE